MNRKTVSILWQIEQEQAKATKVTTVITGMPRGGGQHDQVSSGAIKLAELKEVYSELISELETMRNELAPLIDTLDNIELRAAMRLRYLKGYKPEQIADAITVQPLVNLNCADQVADDTDFVAALSELAYRFNSMRNDNPFALCPAEAISQLLCGSFDLLAVPFRHQPTRPKHGFRRLTRELQRPVPVSVITLV